MEKTVKNKNKITFESFQNLFYGSILGLVLLILTYKFENQILNGWGYLQTLIFCILLLILFWFCKENYRFLGMQFKSTQITHLDIIFVSGLVWGIGFFYFKFSGFYLSSFLLKANLSFFGSLFYSIICFRMIMFLWNMFEFSDDEKNNGQLLDKEISLDRPIDYFDQDELGRQEFVLNLAEMIIERNPYDSFVVGIQGAWGLGKTSILNMLKDVIVARNNDRLEEENKYTERKNQIRNTSKEQNIQLIEFDPWYFNSPEDILNVFFDLLVTNINQNLKTYVEISRLNKIFREYKNSFLSFEMNPEINVLGLLSLKLNLNRTKIKQTLLNKKEKIVDFLNNQQFHFVIFIDNLDRLNGTELLTMLKIIHLCSDFPRITYVLSYDQQQISMQLQSLNIKPDYLEKIIQENINLPIIFLDDILSFVINGLIEIFDSEKFELTVIYPFLNLVLQETNFIRTLRQAKRYLNAVRFGFPLIKGEVNYYDYLILEILRIFSPFVYESLPIYQTDLTNKEKLGEERLKTIIEQLIPNDNNESKDIKNILHKLFPGLWDEKKEFEVPNKLGNRTRISDSRFFHRYFKLRLNNQEVSNAEVVKFCNDLLEEKIEQLDFDEIMRLYIDTGRIDEFLKRITDFPNKDFVEKLRHLLFCSKINYEEKDKKVIFDFLYKLMPYSYPPILDEFIEKIIIESTNYVILIEFYIVRFYYDGFNMNKFQKKPMRRSEFVEKIDELDDFFFNNYTNWENISDTYFKQIRIGLWELLLTSPEFKSRDKLRQKLYRTFKEKPYIVLEVVKFMNIIDEEGRINNLNFGRFLYMFNYQKIVRIISKEKFTGFDVRLIERFKYYYQSNKSINKVF